MADDVLNIDLRKLTVADMDFIEDTLNEKLAELKAWNGGVISFNDVLAQFGDNTERRVTIPQGKITRTLALLQLRQSNPDATWEEAGALRLEAPKAQADLPAPTGSPSSVDD